MLQLQNFRESADCEVMKKSAYPKRTSGWVWEVVQLKFGDLIVPHPPQWFKENDVKSGGKYALH